MTRKNFLEVMAGAAAMAAMPSPAPAAPKSNIKLGVTLYSYTGDYQVTMTLEDCIADVADLGAEGVEILSETHIPGYPNPDSKFIDQWHGWMAKYKTKPTCYDCWIDSRLRKDRTLTVQESLDFLLMDMKLANRMGFHIMRPKLGVVTPDLVPDPVWRETIERALPHAEKLDVRIAPEIHAPTPLQSRIVDGYMDLITKTKTKYFGLLVDFSVFQARERRDVPPRPRAAGELPELLAEDPKHLLPLLPYTYHCHAKFWEMTDELREYSIPYEKVLPVLVENGYSGYLSSEYEGIRDLGRGADQVRRQHVMMRELLAAAV